MLFDGFVRYEAGQGSLENARDIVRRHMARNGSDAVFGVYTSIHNVCSTLLSMNEIVWERFYLCPNGHNVSHSNESQALLSAAVTQFTSISQWVSSNTEQTTACCTACQHPVSIQLRFCRMPPLLAFEFLAQPAIDIDHMLNVQIKDSDRIQRYSLAAVIYYSNHHFTTQIITRDGRVWFYDGMLITNPTVEPTLDCVGSINDPSFSVQGC